LLRRRARSVDHDVDLRGRRRRPRQRRLRGNGAPLRPGYRDRRHRRDVGGRGPGPGVRPGAGTMTLALAVGVAGAVGAIARYLLDGAVQDRSSGIFPYGTLTVNVAGSLVLGFLAGYTLSHAGGGTAKTVVGTGFCGALTTW